MPRDKAGREQVFRDLPGVVTQDEETARKNPSMVCVEKFVERSSRDWGKPQIVYSCTQGNLTFESTQMPYSRERRLRGQARLAGIHAQRGLHPSGRGQS